MLRKPEERRPLTRRPWQRCEGNVKINLKETEWRGVYWIHLAEDSV
jgi:hypothetical protein